MRLRAKSVLLLVVGVVALVLTVQGALRLLVFRELEHAERERTDASVALVGQVTTSLVAEFSRSGADWSDWSDMSSYLATADAAWAESNVSCVGLTSSPWSFLVIVRGDGTELSAVHCHAGAAVGTLDGLRPHLPTLLAGMAADAPPTQGLIQIDGAPYVVSSRPIHDSDGKVTTHRGRMIFATAFDAPWIDRIRQFTKLDLDLGPAAREAPTAIEVSDATMVGHGVVTDLYGAPILGVTVRAPRELNATGAALAVTLTAAVALGAALIALLMLVGIDRGVVRPLRRLATAVQRLAHGDDVRVTATGKDEVAQLGRAFDRMADALAARDQELRAAADQTRRVLDNTGDALLACTLDGRVLGERSAVATRWFGPPRSAFVADDLFGADARAHTAFVTGLAQLVDDVLPFELLVDQLPRTFARDGRRFTVAYHRMEGAGPRGLLLVVSDVTAQLAAEAEQRAAREVQALLGHLIGDPDGFDRFVGEARHLVETIEGAADPAARGRALHTLLGTASIYGLDALAQACHALEAGEGDAPGDATLRALLEDRIARVQQFRGADAARTVRVERAEYGEFVGLVEQRVSIDDLLAVARAWRDTPVRQLLVPLGRQAKRLAAAHGKEVEVEIVDHGVRVTPGVQAEFWGGLVHAIRNAIDHGIEPPAERLAAGKPRVGRVGLTAALVAGQLRVTVTDDGRGVDWAAVRDVARRRGLSADDPAALARALFRDGFTTRTEPTALSGRGLGLAALAAMVDGAGGQVQIVSVDGQGTTLTCDVPFAGAALATPRDRVRPEVRS